MPNVFEVAKLLVAHAVEGYGNEIDLIAYYGSRARGEARADSDLDFFYTPADGKDPPVGRTFLLDGKLYDFWALSWDVLEGFATGAMRGWAFAPALVWYATPLYTRTPEQQQRLEDLRQKTRELQEPAARPRMVGRGWEAFQGVLVHMAAVRLAASQEDITDARYAALKFTESVWECVALVNQTFFHRGMAKAVGELDGLPQVPPGMKDELATICAATVCGELLAACERLARGTRSVLRAAQESLPGAMTPADSFGAAYPEMKDMVTKLLAACAQGNRSAASTTAMHLQADVSLMLSQTRQCGAYGDAHVYSEWAAAYREAGLPDLVALSAGPLDELANAANEFDRRLREWLTSHGVPLHEFETLAQLHEEMRSAGENCST